MLAPAVQQSVPLQIHPSHLPASQRAGPEVEVTTDTRCPPCAPMPALAPPQACVVRAVSGTQRGKANTPQQRAAILPLLEVRYWAGSRCCSPDFSLVTLLRLSPAIPSVATAHQLCTVALSAADGIAAVQHCTYCPGFCCFPTAPSRFFGATVRSLLSAGAGGPQRHPGARAQPPGVGRVGTAIPR